jgi:hypothetical protein
LNKERPFYRMSPWTYDARLIRFLEAQMARRELSEPFESCF